MHRLLSPDTAFPTTPGSATSTPPRAPVQLAGGGGQDLVVGGTISSSNCGVVLSLNASTTHVEAYYAKAVNYTAMVTILSFVQVQYISGKGC